MADLADIAQEKLDAEMAARLFALKQTGDKHIHATGQCLNCDAPLPNPMRWCNFECQEDWSARDKVKG